MRGEFYLLTMAVIAACCIITGIVDDYPQYFLWFFLEQVALGIFTFELIARLKNLTWSHFSMSGEVIWN